MLKTSFATEIVTLKDLKKCILETNMKPKPVCHSLWYIYGWKAFVTDYLTDVPLENHCFYNSFKVSKENGFAKLRAKKLPQDINLVPRAGIRLMIEGHPYGPVGIADFRIDKLNFDQVMKGIKLYSKNLPLLDRMRIESSWDNLRETLENLPWKSLQFDQMLLENLPTQRVECLSIPMSLTVTDSTPPLRGELFPEDPVEGQLEDEVCLGMDVCVYTREKQTRPWLGRIVKVLQNKKSLLQWYTRKSIRSSIFYALLNKDGSPSITELENQMVMFWNVSKPRSRNLNSFSISPHWLKTIMQEYEEMDKNCSD